MCSCLFAPADLTASNVDIPLVSLAYQLSSMALPDLLLWKRALNADNNFINMFQSDARLSRFWVSMATDKSWTWQGVNDLERNRNRDNDV